MHSFQELLASIAWKKFVTSLIWCSIGAHPSPCPISSIPTGPVMLVNICFKAMFHPWNISTHIYSSPSHACRGSLLLLFLLNLCLFLYIFQSFEEVVGMIWNLFSFHNTNYRQIPWEPNLKLLLFKSYQSSNYLELYYLMNLIAIQDSSKILFLGLNVSLPEGFLKDILICFPTKWASPLSKRNISL